MRSECKFFHPIRQPTMRNMEGFHWDQLIEPPIEKTKAATATEKIPVRASVIVMNRKMTTKGLSQSLKDMTL